MAPWVRRVFIHILPRLLVMRRPGQGFEKNTHRYTAAAAAVRASAKESRMNHYDEYGADQPMLQSQTTTGSNKMMHVMDNDHEDHEVYYKKLPPPPPVNGGAHFESASQRWMVTSTSGTGGTATTSVPNDLHNHAATGGGSSTCGSDEDFKVFENSCELHGDPYRGYPPTFECPEIYRALDGVRYIAECTMREEESSKVRRWPKQIQ